MPTTKPWYESKTMWFNLISGALVLAGALVPGLRAFISPEGYEIITAAVVFGNAVLRSVTSQGITLQK